MERHNLVKATLKSRSPKQIHFIIQKLAEIFGKQNITYLSPNYYYKTQIYILDMDIAIPEVLLRNFKKTTGGSEQ